MIDSIYRNAAWVFLVVLLASTSGRTQQGKIKPEVQDYIDRKVREYAERKKTECLERARKEAAHRVDSLLKAMARKHSLDTVRRPDLPSRPRRPDVKFPRDTRPIRPFLDSTRIPGSRMDTSQGVQ